MTSQMVWGGPPGNIDLLEFRCVAIHNIPACRETRKNRNREGRPRRPGEAAPGGNRACESHKRAVPLESLAPKTNLRAVLANTARRAGLRWKLGPSQAEGFQIEPARQLPASRGSGMMLTGKEEREQKENAAMHHGSHGSRPRRR